MDNGFYNYEFEKPVGYDSIPEQKEAMGYVDGTYIEFGKGVTGESQMEAMGFKNFDKTQAYAANTPVIYDGKYYTLIAAHTANANWDAANATEIKFS